jgi:acylphosphatase
MQGTRIVHVVVTGRVQGVGFRAWTQHQAELRGLEGWVRNRRDGAVEAVFAGPPEPVEAMLHALREGPAHAAVNRVDLGEADETLLPTPRSGRFEVLGSA